MLGLEESVRLIAMNVVVRPGTGEVKFKIEASKIKDEPQLKMNI